VKTFGRIVLVVAVSVGVCAGLYLGAKSLWGDSAESSVAASKAALVESQVKALRDQLDKRASTLKSVWREVANAKAATDQEGRNFHLGLVESYLKTLTDQQPAEAGSVADISKSLKAHPVDQREFDEMKATLEKLAAQEFGDPDKKRADLLRKYRK